MMTMPAECVASQVLARRSRGKPCVIAAHLLAAGALLLGSSVFAAPIRSGKDWPIHPQVTRSGDLRRARLDRHAVPHGAVQSSVIRPGTRLNSRLLVTSVRRCVSAMAAISKS